MKKTENISLAGYSFTIEEDAYAVLDRYLKDIRGIFAEDDNAEEIASDIEERIAELLSEKCKGGIVVSLDMINAVKQQIGDPATLAQEEADAQPTQPGRTVARKKKLYRNIDERVLGGVCSGLGSYFGLDKVLFRIIFLILFFIGFADDGLFCISIIAYICLWIAMPAARTVEQKCEMKGKPMNLSGWKDKDFDLGREVSEAAASPAGQTFKRAGGVFLGLLMLVIGSGILLGSIITPSVPTLMENLYESHMLEWGLPDFEDQLAADILTDSTFWWLTISMMIIMGVWFVYNGIMLTFDLKAPRWKPGLVLFIAWIFCLLAIAAWALKMTADFLPTITI